MKNYLILTLLILGSCNNPKIKTNAVQKDILITDVNEFNGKKVDDFKNFFKYSVELVKYDSITSYGFTFLLDTLSESHILYALMEESPTTTKENPNIDWTIKCGLKIENLSSKQVNYTCNNFCTKQDVKKEKYLAIVKDYNYGNSKITIEKAYRLDFEKMKFQEISIDSVKCDITEGDD